VTVDQGIVFGVLLAALVLFIAGKWRYDLVALLALLAVTVIGLVPADAAFAGFGHPAVVTVAAVLVVSRGLRNAGVVDLISGLMLKVGKNPSLQVLSLTALVTALSAFMNNIGALALLLPVAVQMARNANRSPSFLLMPLAFGSLLGGMTTLIGTPPNIIIATFREQTGAEPFRMFDFAPVGVGIAGAGVIFIALVGWRLHRQFRAPHRDPRSTGVRDRFPVRHGGRGTAA
jgi:di/tricarboxylate transporter